MTVSQTVEDEVRRIAVARFSAKLHSCQCVVDADGTAKVRCVFRCSLFLFGISSGLNFGLIISLKLSFVQQLNIVLARLEQVIDVACVLCLTSLAVIPNMIRGRAKMKKTVTPSLPRSTDSETDGHGGEV